MVFKMIFLFILNSVAQLKDSSLCLWMNQVAIQVRSQHSGQFPNLLPGWRSHWGRPTVPAYRMFPLDVKSASQANQGQSWAHACPPPRSHHLNNPILLHPQAKNPAVTHETSLLSDPTPISLQMLSSLSMKCMQNPATLTTFTITTLLPPIAASLLVLFGPCFPPFTLNPVARVTV